MDNNRIGIFGGTFNPIHYGHLRVAEEVRERIGLKKILFIPSGIPPLKVEDLAPARHRYEMARLSIDTNPLFQVSDIECRRPEKSYTVETLASLKDAHPEREFYLILGIDSFLDIPSWYQPERLMGFTNFVIVSRPGFRFSILSTRITIDADILSGLDAGNIESYKTVHASGREIFLLNVTSIDISATAIRRLVRNGMSIKYLLPESVESYIISNRLYRRNE
ncbi:MAG: nicotinate-nucleotide adenylyltransferase [Thermodesulfovibrionales bacterium]